MRLVPRLLTAVLLTVPAGTAAQGTMTGTVFDSLVSGRPLAGASVTVLGTDRRVSTDDRGRFSFDSMPAGEHVVAFWSPLLDSLALAPVQATVRFGNGLGVGPVVLATPSPGSYARLKCGMDLGAASGVLVGEVRDAGGAGRSRVAVAALWEETTIGVGHLDRVSLATVDTTGADGRFVLCGVPVASAVTLRARLGADVRSGDVIASIDGRVGSRDLIVSGPGSEAIVAGRVVSADGAPLAGASLSVTGDSTVLARTTVDGRFAVRVRRASAQLEVRALSHEPFSIDIAPTEDHLDLADLRLVRIPPTLAAMITSGRAVTRERLDFEHRRRVGLGQYIDESFTERFTVLTVSMVASQTSLLHAAAGMLYFRRGGGYCIPRMFVDGFYAGKFDQQDLSGALRWAKRIEVYRATFAPPQFQDFDGCGALVVWTR